MAARLLEKFRLGERRCRDNLERFPKLIWILGLSTYRKEPELKSKGAKSQILMHCIFKKCLILSQRMSRKIPLIIESVHVTATIIEEEVPLGIGQEGF